MEEWFGLTPTGRQFREPTGVQHELIDAEGVRHTAIVFDPPWHGHPVLTRGVELVRSFLEYPMVVGMVELSHADPQRGVFVYPTGTVWTLKELLRIHADLGHAIGPRAALELCWLAGQVLLEGAENGGMQGCFSHGGLTPWRIALRSDGNLQVLGFGLPQVDVLAERAKLGVAEADSVRYAPPERLTGIAEDVSADTLALTLIAYEVLTGRPLYDGSDPEELRRAVSMSDGVTTLSRPNPLPRDIAQVFARALVFDPDARLGGEAWLQEIEHLLEQHQDGESLDVVVDRVRGAHREGALRGTKLRQAKTESFTPNQLRDALAEADEPPAPRARSGRSMQSQIPAAAGGDEKRWGKVAERRRREPAAAAPTPPPAQEIPATPPSPRPSSESAAPRRRRRGEPRPADELSTSSLEIPSLEVEHEDDEDDILLEPAEPTPAAPPRRRRRREE
ncbi:MAG: hypothetical protein H6738_16175 [Alphaproteobacteria bacterium]|nr:hypothetical protein [Alphaproteobacteria bacterium]MCB9698317.1 hypothetical protein [Alphaproteobacteria bacterium]